MSSSIGKIFKITVFGESHSESIGVVIDGVVPGVLLDLDEISFEMKRRAPGKNEFSTPRKEADDFEIQSGFFNGFTTGTPLCAIIKNTNTRSGDYAPEILRPSHADFAAKKRYQGFSDYRGGGHFSGRLTAPIVFAGAVAKQCLKKCGIDIFAHIKSVKDVKDFSFLENIFSYKELDELKNMTFPVLNNKKAALMEAEILKAKESGDSVGGVIECMATGVDSGLGNPMFESVESKISSMMFSVPAVKGIEFGAGFEISEMTGSAANDCFKIEKGEIVTKTNNNGGINGGITNGMPIIFSVAIKPTPSISKPQETVNFDKMEECTTKITGRHDPCIVQRAVCVIEAATAITLLDLYLEGKCYAE